MAAVTATVDFKELGDLLPRLQKSFNAGLIKTVDQQARLLLRNENNASLIKFTPPRGLDEGKEIGNAAVSRDINRVFVSATTVRSVLKNSGARGARIAFRRYTAPGPDYSMARALDYLNKQTPTTVEVRPYTTKKGKRVKSYTQTRKLSDFGDNRLGRLSFADEGPSAYLHKSRKNARGRVNQAAWSMLVMKQSKLNSYIEQVQKRVGTVKAGWRFAARALGVSLPPYVNNATNKANGSFKTSPASSGPWAAYWVEMTNTTPRVDQMLPQSTVDWLLGVRLKTMEESISRRTEEAIKATK
jgi:hypothetical protein